MRFPGANEYIDKADGEKRGPFPAKQVCTLFYALSLSLSLHENEQFPLPATLDWGFLLTVGSCS